MITTSERIGTALQQFEQLVRRSRSRAYHLAYRLTGNAADAEDVTQDAYLRAWSHFEGFDPSRSFEGWLFRIITNRAIDLNRRRTRVRLCSLDAPVYEAEGALPSHRELAAPDSNPAQRVINLMEGESLEQALEGLPELYRQTLLLFVVEERSYMEVAQAMGCPMGTVRSRVHRARMMMRRRSEGVKAEAGQDATNGR